MRQLESSDLLPPAYHPLHPPFSSWHPRGTRPSPLCAPCAARRHSEPPRRKPSFFSGVHRSPPITHTCHLASFYPLKSPKAFLPPRLLVSFLSIHFSLSLPGEPSHPLSAPRGLRLRIFHPSHPPLDLLRPGGRVSSARFEINRGDREVYSLAVSVLISLTFPVFLVDDWID